MGKQYSNQIFNLLLNEDDVTWQSIIYDLVKTGDIDPWDVDVSQLAAEYLQMLKKLKDMDFRVSGKVLLAAAVLLKIKSNRFLGSDMSNFDNMFNQPEETLSDYMEEGLLDDQLRNLENGEEKPLLIPKTPQPRERKVSIFDLVDALQQALDVKKRRVLKDLPDVEIKIPEKTRDITEVIREVYGKIKTHFSTTEKTILGFNELIPSNSKEDKIMTFIPLLHLENQQRVNLVQHKHFSPIFIKMLNKKQ